MSVSRIPPSSTSPADTGRPGQRAKTVATRLNPEELQEVEAAAERDGKSLAEWLRELALRSARERVADPIELLLAELMATRYALLNLFHATALAGALLERPSSLNRHREAPLLKERERFLRRQQQQGTSRAALRNLSGELIHVVRLLRLRELRDVSPEKIHRSGEALLTRLGKYVRSRTGCFEIRTLSPTTNSHV
jgi:hypothetical protein